MRQSVRDVFFDFSTKFEGAVDFPYLDVKGLLTTGIGNLIENDVGLGLPWNMLTLRPATIEEIHQGLDAVKARQDLKLRGGMAYKNISLLRLTQDDITKLVLDRMASNESELLCFFPAFEDFSAPAQLAIMSIAWACGAAFAQTWPNFKRAANSQDWVTAAAESHISDGAPARNDANHYLLLQAACIAKDGGDPDNVCWPMPPEAA